MLQINIKYISTSTALLEASRIGIGRLYVQIFGGVHQWGIPNLDQCLFLLKSHEKKGMMTGGSPSWRNGNYHKNPESWQVSSPSENQLRSLGNLMNMVDPDMYIN